MNGSALRGAFLVAIFGSAWVWGAARALRSGEFQTNRIPDRNENPLVFYAASLALLVVGFLLAAIGILGLFGAFNP